MVSHRSRATDTTRAMDALRRFVRSLQRSSIAVERASGLSGAQLFVLRQLADRPAKSVNELAERTETHQSSVSVVVRRLVEAGLVERSRDADDARRVRLALSRQGVDVLASAPQPAQARLVAALRRMPAAKRRQLADGLELWLAAAGLDRQPASFFFEDETGAASSRSRRRRSRS